jgi:DnaK suppressor protein
MAHEKVKSLTKKQIETLKKKMEEEKKSLILSFHKDASEFGLDSEASGDEIDQAIADYNSSHLLRFRNREVFYLKKLDKSLKKLEKGEYGLCTECDGPIKFERLLARPTAEMCILCKEESERDESLSISGKTSKSLGKTVDFTTNTVSL